MRTIAPLLLIIGTGSAAFAAACSSGSSSSELDVPADAPPNATPLASDGGIDAAVAPAPTTDQDLPTAPYLRRLTKLEYQNTVTDLFPGMTFSFEDLVDDTREKGKFDNDVAEQGATEAFITGFEAEAEAIATVVVANDKAVKTCEGEMGATQDKCANAYFSALVPRVYRRPPTSSESARVTAFYDASKQTYDYPTAMQMAIAGILLTPQFLYRVEMVKGNESASAIVALDPYEMASRLSYFFWGSMPDDALFAAAAANKLATPDDVEKQARRMLTTAGARAAVTNFHDQWLDLDQVANIAKDPKAFPEVNAALEASMRAETEKFSTWNFFDGPGTLDAFLTTPQSFVDQNNAVIYGVSAPATMSLVSLDPKERAGVLTQSSLQSVLGHDEIGSPILRGVFVMDRFLCEYLVAPADIPPAPSPSPDAGTATETERQMFTDLTSASSCSGCHDQINPIGFSFGHYDAIGKWRDTDHGLPIDATGSISGVGSFDGAIALATELAQSAEVRDCVTRHWFRFAMGRDETSTDQGSIASIDQGFTASGYKLQELLVTIARSRAFSSRLGAAQ